MAIELRHLRQLRALAREQSFSRAAAALHITQPALSRSIQAIESIVGAALFERKRGAIAPTAVGRVLLRHAESIEHSLVELDHDLRHVKQPESEELRIGVGAYAGSMLIGPVLGRLNRLHPGCRIRVVTESWVRSPLRLRGRELDLILLNASLVEGLPDVEVQRIGELAQSFVVRQGHPLCALANPRPQDLLRYPLISSPWPADEVEKLIQWFPPTERASLRMRGVLAAEVESSHLLAAMTRQCNAIAILPGVLLADTLESNGLVILSKLDCGLMMDFAAARLRERAPAPATRDFLRLLREHVATLAASLPSTPRSRARPGRRRAS